MDILKSNFGSNVFFAEFRATLCTWKCSNTLVCYDSIRKPKLPYEITKNEESRFSLSKFSIRNERRITLSRDSSSSTRETKIGKLGTGLLAQMDSNADIECKSEAVQLFANEEADWLEEELYNLLNMEGQDSETCSTVSKSCAQTLRQFLLDNDHSFDPLMLMDVIEEGLERCGGRGDFLPFEIGQKAAQLLCRKWELEEEPSGYIAEVPENTLDIVDLNSLPMNREDLFSGRQKPDFGDDVFDADSEVEE